MTIESNINQATLAHLSVAAAELWSEIENLSEEEDLTAVLENLLLLQDATADKIDALAYVCDQLKVDLETWEIRLQKVVELHSQIIRRRQQQIQSLKGYLLRLHQLGMLPDRVVGNERRIDFQNSPPSVELLVEPESLPPEYQSVKVIAKSKEILSAHKRGEDVSAVALIESGKHVRFRHISPREKGGK
jgi:hypothetical protein